MIELKHGGGISGEFMGLTEDFILLKEYAREKTYPKDAVAQVKWMRPGSRARNAAILGGIFLGIGFGLGYAGAPDLTDQNHPPAGERAAVAAGMGAGLGVAAAIALVHRPGLRGEVIYKTK